MNKTNKLTVPDLISIGVFTALYFVLVTIATFASVAIFPGFNNVVLPAFCALISGCVYTLLVVKLQKFGGISVMGIVMGLFFMISGHFIISFAANIVMGIVADCVAKVGKYKSKKWIILRCVQLRKHSKAREKRYSFGYAVSFIFACYQILWTFPKSRYLCSRYLPLVCG